MNEKDRNQTKVYSVVVNQKKQYAIWPTDRPNLAGWRSTGKTGSDLDCLAHIKTLPTRPDKPDPKSRLLFDLTEPELVVALARYAPDAPLASLHDQLRSPFQAERFPDLIEEVGPDAAPKVLASLWAQAREGVAPDRLARHFSAEIERWADLWNKSRQATGHEDALQAIPRALGGPLRCGPAVRADSGPFRIKVNTTRVSAILASYGSVRVDHSKRNSAGKYRDEKADRLEVEGSVFLGISGFPVQKIAISKVELNATKAKASYSYAGFAQIPFVEGCGGINAGSPLWACACSGRNPGAGGEGGGFGPGGDGIIDGG